MNSSRDSEKDALAGYRELDWFEFETRMRQLISQMIEPSFDRQKDDRIEIENLARHNHQLQKRIKRVETMLGMSDTSITLREEFKTSISEIESQRAANQVSVDQRFTELKQYIDRNSAKIFENQNFIAGLSKETKTAREEIERFNQLVDKNLKLTNDRMHQVTSETYEIVERLGFDVEACNNSSQDNQAKISEHLKRLNEINSSIEGLHKTLRDVHTNFIKLKQDKLNRTELESYSDNVENRFLVVNEQSSLIKGEIKEIERYLDSYLPLETQACISDNFYACLDRPQQIKFVNFEINKYKYLNNEYGELRTEIEVLTLMNRAIAQGRRAEHRKTEFIHEVRKLEKLYKPEDDEEAPLMVDNSVPSKIGFTKAGIILSPTRSVTSSQRHSMFTDNSNRAVPTNSQVPKIASVTVNVDELHEQFKSYTEEEKQEYRSFAQDVKNTLDEQISRLKEDLKRIKEDMYRGDEETKIYVQMLYDKEDKNNKSEKKMSSEMKALYDEIQRQGSITSRLKIENSTFTELIACIVEFCLICHNLLTQDEDDRQGLQLTGYKDVVQNGLPSIDRKKTIAVSGECLSCSGNTKAIMSGFKMACLSYNPSPLKYRNNIYNRAQLLELMGNMMQTSWGKVSLKPPYDRFPHISYSEPIRKKKVTNLSRTLNISTQSVPPLHFSVETSRYTSQNALSNV